MKEKTGKYGFMNHLIGAVIADIIFHPLHLIESRYILQNRIHPTYKSFLTFFVTSYSQIYRGWMSHLPKNVIMAIAGFSIFSSKSYISLIWKEILFSALVYPIMTAWRRIEAQSNKPGMIPKRYKNVRHCFGLTYREEGIKGLYRGFTSFAIGITIFTAIVPFVAFIASRKNPLFGLRDEADDVE